MEYTCTSNIIVKCCSEPPGMGKPMSGMCHAPVSSLCQTVLLHQALASPACVRIWLQTALSVKCRVFAA